MLSIDGEVQVHEQRAIRARALPTAAVALREAGAGGGIVVDVGGVGAGEREG